jgi:Putative Ig domain
MGYMKASLISIFFLILVSQCAASLIEITTTKVANGTVDADYSAMVKAQGGCTPYRWAVISGRFPFGITGKASTNSIDLDLSGTPTKAETSSFTVSVTDCGGHVAKETYTMVIQAAAEHVVDLKWHASDSKNIAGYNVYRGPDGAKWTKINAGLIAATDYDDSTVSNGSTYYYSSTAVNIEGEESKKSAAIKVSIP